MTKRFFQLESLIRVKTRDSNKDSSDYGYWKFNPEELYSKEEHSEALRQVPMFELEIPKELFEQMYAFYVNNNTNIDNSESTRELFRAAMMDQVK